MCWKVPRRIPRKPTLEQLRDASGESSLAEKERQSCPDKSDVNAERQDEQAKKPGGGPLAGVTHGRASIPRVRTAQNGVPIRQLRRAERRLPATYGPNAATVLINIA